MAVNKYAENGAIKNLRRVMSKIKTVLNTSDKFTRDVFTAVDMYRCL